MSRYRLTPTPEQETVLREHCAHARYVWNLAVEQQSWWRPGRIVAPGYCTQAAQLTQARAAALRAREGDRRKDWAEKTSTSLARRFDVIRVEDLYVPGMTRSARGTRANPGRGVRQKAGLNRGILASGWGLLARRLQDKAPGRIEKINPAYTSQQCSACKYVAAESRKSQALFRCTACGYVDHADVNAAKNIAAGHAVTARGRSPLGGRVNREPQPLPLSA
jgi:putative transposase